VWGLHLIKWYLCTEPRFRGSAAIKAEALQRGIARVLPDIAVGHACTSWIHLTHSLKAAWFQPSSL
jgi:hypothetical protein